MLDVSKDMLDDKATSQYIIATMCLIVHVNAYSSATLTETMLLLTVKKKKERFGNRICFVLQKLF